MLYRFKIIFVRQFSLFSEQFRISPGKGGVAFQSFLQKRKAGCSRSYLQKQYRTHCFRRSFSYFYRTRCRYFSLVARPPLICLSDLFLSRTWRTSAAKPGLISANLSEQSLCTVLLLIPNFFAACLTVAFVSII